MTQQTPGNFCVSCGRDFGSVSSFDRHRIGPHDGERRCLTDQELALRGYRRTARGRLTLGQQLDHGRAFDDLLANPSTSHGRQT